MARFEGEVHAAILLIAYVLFNYSNRKKPYIKRFSEAAGANKHLPASPFLLLHDWRFWESPVKCTLLLNLLTN